MRLFVAIELDDSARDAVAREQQRLRTLLGTGGGRALKWVSPDHIHLTLVFLGEVTDDRAAAIAESLRGPLLGRAFRVVFGGLGVFPAHGAPRVLWMGLRRGGSEVMAVQQQIVERIGRLGIALEDQSLHPHLTLARWRRSRESDRRLALQGDSPVDVAQLDVTAVTLLQSRLLPAGPSYTALERTRLGEYAGPPLQSQ